MTTTSTPLTGRRFAAESSETPQGARRAMPEPSADGIIITGAPTGLQADVPSNEVLNLPPLRIEPRRALPGNKFTLPLPQSVRNWTEEHVIVPDDTAALKQIDETGVQEEHAYELVDEYKLFSSTTRETLYDEGVVGMKMRIPFPVRTRLAVRRFQLGEQAGHGRSKGVFLGVTSLFLDIVVGLLGVGYVTAGPAWFRFVAPFVIMAFLTSAEWVLSMSACVKIVPVKLNKTYAEWIDEAKDVTEALRNSKVWTSADIEVPIQRFNIDAAYDEIVTNANYVDFLSRNNVDIREASKTLRKQVDNLKIVANEVKTLDELWRRRRPALDPNRLQKMSAHADMLDAAAQAAHEATEKASSDQLAPVVVRPAITMKRALIEED